METIHINITLSREDVASILARRKMEVSDDLMAFLEHELDETIRFSLEDEIEYLAEMFQDMTG